MEVADRGGFTFWEVFLEVHHAKTTTRAIEILIFCSSGTHDRTIYIEQNISYFARVSFVVNGVLYLDQLVLQINIYICDAQFGIKLIAFYNDNHISNYLNLLGLINQTRSFSLINSVTNISCRNTIHAEIGQGMKTSFAIQQILNYNYSSNHLTILFLNCMPKLF
ncbi:hypothetical protein ACJX0J_041842, partial [Zea mays]